MQRLIVILFLLSPGLASAEWVFLPETTLAELYSVPESEIQVQSGVPAVAGLSWPNGNQALVTYVEAFDGAEKSLHKCIEYYSAEMENTGTDCYRLVEE